MCYFNSCPSSACLWDHLKGWTVRRIKRSNQGLKDGKRGEGKRESDEIFFLTSAQKPIKDQEALGAGLSPVSSGEELDIMPLSSLNSWLWAKKNSFPVISLWCLKINKIGLDQWILLNGFITVGSSKGIHWTDCSFLKFCIQSRALFLAVAVDPHFLPHNTA